MKICVIGAGGWGKNHINTLNKLDVLYGIVDFDKDILGSYKDINTHCSFFTDLESTIDQNFDGYVIATPAETHYSIAKQLLSYSKNILVEKPICLKSKQSEELLNLAQENNVFIMGGHLLLFHPAFIKMKEIINSGILGDIVYMYSNRLNFGKVRLHENALWSLAPHDISLFLFFAESTIVNTSYEGSSLLNNEIHDSCLSTFKFHNNIMGHIFVSWLHPFKEHRFIINCEKGMLVYEDSLDIKKIFLYKKYFQLKENKIIENNKGLEELDFPKTFPLENQLQYFIKSIESKSRNLDNMKLSSDVVNILESLGEKNDICSNL